MPRNRILWVAAIGAATAGLLPGPGFAQPGARVELLGTPMSADSHADRVVRIGPTTRWANARENETVKFLVRTSSGAEQAFAWRFTTPFFAVDLSKIAPLGLIDRPLLVYLETDPQGQND